MAAKDWGLQCLRYEISKSFMAFALVLVFFCDVSLDCFTSCLLPSGDISPPRGVRVAMEMQAEAERKKRAQVLESEGNEVSLTCQVFLSG